MNNYNVRSSFVLNFACRMKDDELKLLGKFPLLLSCGAMDQKSLRIDERQVIKIPHSIHFTINYFSKENLITSPAPRGRLLAYNYICG